MKHDPANPQWEGRDRFVLSKGHAAPALYVALAEAGYFPKEDLMMLRRLGSHLQGHPDSKGTPGVEVCTGSLGQGLSMANGMAMALKLDGKPNRVYVMLGDGELQEGQVWEAAMCAAHNKLDNLTAIIDRNRLQIDGLTEEIMALENLRLKWKAFGWNVLTVNGHSIKQLDKVFRNIRQLTGKPTALIARTVKGKGVDFMENQVKWHGGAPKGEEADKALKQLEKQMLKTSKPLKC
jgi:transketolase